jgi:hypothetical protein
MTTVVPTVPVFGLRFVIVGAGTVTVKLIPLLAWPPTVTITLPVVAPVGTVTVMLVALHAVAVAAMPLNVTVLVPCVAPKFVPVMTIVLPTAPAFGFRLLMEGTNVRGGVSPPLVGVEAHPCCKKAAANMAVICIQHKAYFQRVLAFISIFVPYL